ncbi:MAG: regulatory protein RecX, partial [Dehalococcoidia bacterium]
MPLVTEVKPRKRGLVAAVSLDGRDEPVLLAMDTVALHHIREGVHVPADEWREVESEGRRLLAVRRALEILARRQKTERELRTDLCKRFEPAEADHAIDRMRTLGYLDDGAVARHYVASPRSAGRGRAMLRHELGQRGVPDALAAPAIADHDERGAAHEAARKRWRALRRIEEPRRSRRLYDFLRRRGFPDPLAREAMAAAIAEAASPPSSPSPVGGGGGGG